MQPATYILASEKNGVIYIGVTSNLAQRIEQHKSNVVPGFTKKYNVHQLVHYELHTTMEQAIIREKRLKRWQRQWKVQLIEQENPHWDDLSSTLT